MTKYSWGTSFSLGYAWRWGLDTVSCAAQSSWTSSRQHSASAWLSLSLYQSTYLVAFHTDSLRSCTCQGTGIINNAKAVYGSVKLRYTSSIRHIDGFNVAWEPMHLYGWQWRHTPAIWMRALIFGLFTEQEHCVQLCLLMHCARRWRAKLLQPCIYASNRTDYYSLCNQTQYEIIMMQVGFGWTSSFSRRHSGL